VWSQVGRWVFVRLSPDAATGSVTVFAVVGVGFDGIKF